MPSAGDISPGERALGTLLDRSHSLRPHEVPAIVRETATGVGALDAVVYVVDMDQRWLVRLDQTDERLDIDGTIAGRVFRTREQLEVDGVLWLPVLDGADRVGVLQAVLGPDADDAMRTRLRWLASLAAELIVTKAEFGDSIVLAKRTRPMGLAAELRWALLPPLTFRNDHVEIAAMFEPAYDVAGDAFDYSADEDTAHIALFDAMGHGLEATRMANMAIAAYRNGRRAGTALPKIITFIDEVLHEQFGSEHFVTGLLIELDLRSGEVRYVSAGHPFPLLLRGTHVVGQLDGRPSVPMGVGSPTPMLSTASLEVGDQLLLYTDGVTEAIGPDGEEFGVDRLANLLEHAAMAGEIPSETTRRLTHSVLEHAKVLRDDATLVLLGWPAPLQ